MSKGMEMSMVAGLIVLLITTAIILAWATPVFDGIKGTATQADVGSSCGPPDWPGAVKCTQAQRLEMEPGERNIQYIVLHYTAGHTIEGAFEAFKKEKTSAHYVVGGEFDNFRVEQFVKEKDVAFHAGCPKGWTCPIEDLNSKSIGIEIVNYGFNCEGKDCEEIGGKSWEPYPREQLEKVEDLVLYLVDKYGIPLSGDYVIGHSEAVNPRSDGSRYKLDPGPLFDKTELVANVRELQDKYTNS